MAKSSSCSNSSSSSISSRMMIICYYVVLSSLLLSLIEFHPINGLPINPFISQDGEEEAKSFQIDLRRNKSVKDANAVQSVSLLWRMRRSASSAAVSGESLATASPEKSNRKKATDSIRNSYYNRSGWGGGYGRRWWSPIISNPRITNTLEFTMPSPHAIPVLDHET